MARCEPVRQGCSPRSESVKVTSSHGYLVNTRPPPLDDPASPGGRQVPRCGSASCPWRLHAEPGQRINLTVVHFAVGAATHDMGPAAADAPVVCHRVAAVREAGAVYRDLTACHDPAAAAGTRRYAPSSSSSPGDRTPAGVLLRRKPIYWSETNSLQLMFYAAANVHVILRYEGARQRVLVNYTPNSWC